MFKATGMQMCVSRLMMPAVGSCHHTKGCKTSTVGACRLCLLQHNVYDKLLQEGPGLQSVCSVHGPDCCICIILAVQSIICTLRVCRRHSQQGNAVIS